MRRKISVFLTLFILMILPTFKVYGEYVEINIEDEVLEAESFEGLDMEVDVKVPVIKGMSDEKEESRINERIKRSIEEDMNDFVKKVERERYFQKSEFQVDYKVGSRERVLSIVIDRYERYGGSRRGETTKEFYNIDLKSNELIDLEDLFLDGEDYKSIINRSILEEIDKNKDEYYTGDEKFESIDEKPYFYFNDEGELIVVFEEYKIAPRAQGFPEFNVYSNALNNMMKPHIKKIIDVDLEIENVEVSSDMKEVIINIPKITGFADKKFEFDLNKELNDGVEKALEEFREKSRGNSDGKSDLSISYDIKNDGDILSFVINKYHMYEGDSNGETIKRFYNIDAQNGKKLELSDLFKEGSNFKEIIDDKIKLKIKDDKDSYFSGSDGFKSIKKDQDFFIDEHDNIVIEFAQYEIAPGSTGTPQFKIANYYLKDIFKDGMMGSGLKYLDRIIIDDQEIELEDEIFISNRGSIMIHLPTLAEKLGYKINWDEKTQLVKVEKGNDKIGLSLKKNYYYLNDATMLLEEQGASVDGKAYIPKQFIQKLLKKNVIVDDKGILKIF